LLTDITMSFGIAPQPPERRGDLGGQLHPTQGNGRQQHQRDDPVGALIGDELGDLRAHAVPEEDDRTFKAAVDNAEDVQRQPIQRERPGVEGPRAHAGQVRRGG
jgi:hypothetical protein